MRQSASFCLRSLRDKHLAAEENHVSQRNNECIQKTITDVYEFLPSTSAAALRTSDMLKVSFLVSFNSEFHFRS